MASRSGPDHAATPDVAGVTIWIEERDKRVWHRAESHLGYYLYRAKCRWELDTREGRIYPQRSGEPGPPIEERCHDCQER
jgi:hypothetical protein